jgi:hypothetical protein
MISSNNNTRKITSSAIDFWLASLEKKIISMKKGRIDIKSVCSKTKKKKTCISGEKGKRRLAYLYPDPTTNNTIAEIVQIEKQDAALYSLPTTLRGCLAYFQILTRGFLAFCACRRSFAVRPSTSN